mgnify:CR=1 FL=1
MRPPSPSLMEEAERLALAALSRQGARAERLMAGVLLLRQRDGQERLVRVLARRGPHHRGGRGALGMHWLLPPGPEELVALTDVGRRLVWLLPRREFEARARPQAGGRHHLDWLVLPLGPSSLPLEEEFEGYLLGREGVPDLIRGGAQR